MIHSFDIFDTCLVRSCGHPHGVFYLMAESLLPNDANSACLAEFIQLRIQAETKAKANLLVSEEVTLDDIYNHMDLAPFPGMETESVKATELRIEKEVLYPVLSILNRINSLRSEGNQILFISDMYLPKAFIQDVLTELGFYHSGDGLFVSSDTGVLKATGKMYEYLIHSEKLPVKDWLHCGDNRHSDVKMAAAYGLKAQYCRTTEWNRYEKEWLKYPCPGKTTFTAMLFAGSIRTARLLIDEDYTQSTPIKVGANIAAPLFIPFVIWVLQDASRRRIKKLYFVARDGYIFHQIAKRFQSFFPELEIKYLHGSRRAWYLASITEVNREELEWMLSGYQGRTPEQMLLRLNLDTKILGDCKLPDPTFLKRPLESNSFNIFIDLLTNPPVKNLIRQAASEARKLTNAYLKQEGVLEGKGAIVDLGWSRTCQRAINRICNLSEADKLYAYYFSVFRKRQSITNAGPFSAMFIPMIIGSDNQHRLFASGTAILEQALALAPHGSTYSYAYKDMKIVPVQEPPENVSSTSTEFQENLHKVIIKACDLLISHTSIMTSPEFYCQHFGMSAFTRFMTRPGPDEADCISAIHAGNNLNDNVSLAPKIGPRYLIKKAINLQRPRLSDSLWPAGSISRSFRFAAPPILLLLDFYLIKFKQKTG